MRLSNKLLLILGIIWIVTIAAAYFGTQYIMRSFLTIENNQIHQNITRARQALDQVSYSLGTFTTDWAHWTDAYNYMEGTNPKFAEVNLLLEPMVTSNINFLIYFDKNGKLLAGIAADTENSKLVSYPVGLDKYIRPDGLLVKRTDIKNDTRGFIHLPSGIMMVAAAAVSNSDVSKPIAGALVAGRYLSKNILEKIAETTRLKLDLYLPADMEKTQAFKTAYQQVLDNADGEAIKLENDNTAYAYILLRDIDNKPIGIIRLTMSREIYLIGTDTTYYYMLAFVIFGVILGALTWFLLRVFILKRLEQLSREIAVIGVNKTFSNRVSATGSDEIYFVAHEINTLLNVIQDYSVQLNKTLNDLKIAEAFLTDIINSMPSVLVIMQKNMRIIHWNHAAEKIAAVSLEEAKEKSIFNLFPFLLPYQEKVKQAFSLKSVFFIDKVIYAPGDGSRIYYYQITFFPLHAAEDEIALHIDDISNKIKIEETLAQRDKLASIGVLTAGVAHEINNPINFISSSIDPLKSNIADLKQVFEACTAININDDMQKIKAQLEKINQLKSVLNVDVALKEIDSLLTNIQAGTLRTTEIVKALKTFSRLDENVVKKANVHESIDSTLTMLQHLMKNKIEVIKNYGTVPEIDCHPGKLNQVFMNILSNAIDAIDGNGKIWLKTERLNDHIVLSFKDSGHGIPKQNVAKIFEPFFTTKEVQEGTGLGLSISYSIIRDHNGTIEVNSEVGKGTEFIITLPIEQPYINDKKETTTE